MSQPTGKRRKSRELAMQMLFQADIGKQDPRPGAQELLGGARRGSRPDVRGFAEDLYRIANVKGRRDCGAHHEARAELAARAHAGCRSQACCAMATAEMLGFPATPAPIVINEALEVARRFFGARVHQLSERRTGCHRPCPPRALAALGTAPWLTPRPGSRPHGTNKADATTIPRPRPGCSPAACRMQPACQRAG